MIGPQRYRPEPATSVRLGLWGPPGSGKTTFLAALQIATTRAQGAGPVDWIMSGRDDASVRFLVESVHRLATEKRFPTATDDSRGLSFRFSGVHTGQRLRWQKRPPETLSFELDVLDVPGRFYDGSPVDETGADFAIAGAQASTAVKPDARLIDHLHHCDGIIFLFDPQREERERDAFRYFHGVLQRLTGKVMENETFPGPRLPHRVAVCVSKFDDYEVFDHARRSGYTVRSTTPPHMPEVSPDRARQYFASLCADPGSNADLVESGLRQYFDTLGYFVSSSIGFNIGRKRFQLNDFLNTHYDGDALRIRDAVRPINVLEPLLWLHDSVRQDQRR
ncbi:hypothetical protein V5P93_007202 [Actinokineospora auranticolor]|uniref:Uncharacterized protein n=1 Tax=Actinokineospora auranticolor TaxID=155976 RepID=A0A2S6GRM6_9PSEU|nr:hypothetical protein [Actinokineospora auranticolor]PPK67860.1 hypothetical protein CLV40_10690 [Actinokineospora auranticolor]